MIARKQKKSAADKHGSEEKNANFALSDPSYRR
jgi:hypothetical protein